MRKVYSSIFILFITGTVSAQFYQPTPGEDTTKAKDLDTVVVTGQYKPQSVKNSVYQVRTISQQRIRLSGATNVQQVLSTELGFRFSGDNTLGTTDVQLMRVSGRNVKILLDGVPLTDRGDTRESLNQVDINTIERIEIVEGPMSVSYGSDAIAGVINLITKKNISTGFSVSAQAREETAGSEYYPFSYKGVHTQNAAISYKKNNWDISTGGTHNDFNGIGGDAYGRGKAWRPKEQWLGNIRTGYGKSSFSIYYRLDGLHEVITDRDSINYLNYKAIDKKYTTNRFTQQVQSQLQVSAKADLSTILSFTNYERQTRTTRHNFETGTDELTTGAGEQDISKLNSFVFRNTFHYQLSKKISLQPGIDINREAAKGQRITGNPVITDYALFVSAEIKPTGKINIRPGLRFIRNSIYDAPPVVPSVNTKFVLNDHLDLRLAYAYGFRSPALRELYFEFIDANHNIVGNPNLKAETSNSFNGSLNWAGTCREGNRFNISFSGFYTDFNNQIAFALADPASNQYTYFNVNKARITGGTVEAKISGKTLQASTGFSYTGFDRELYDDKDYIKVDTKKFLWAPEFNSSASFTAAKIRTTFSLYYKYTGKTPQYVTGKNASNQPILYIARTAAYHQADLSAYSAINKYIAVTGGVKNLFDVTNVASTAASSGSIHDSGNGTVIGYGRSYFLGLNFKWNKK
jgi:outer membrane receptor for ferrienterochelin and colicins